MSVLIAIEGIDGSGKGTQSARLTRELQAQGFNAAMLQFPRYSATTFGAAIGEFLNGRFGELNEVHPQLASVLYAGDRFESRDLLRSMMNQNDIVVLDRFVGSNLAHQGAKLSGEERSELIAWIEHIEFAVFGLPRPDLTVLIDMSTDWSRELVSRKDAREYTDREADLQESDLPYLDRVRQCYLQIARGRDDWNVVRGLAEDGSLRSIEDVGQEILETVMRHPAFQVV
ncbi:MAG: thymidylate kinase [Planctomycetaceae bacterium]|nr:thymidylate kinase [Planctomycetaceae bacterium]